MSDANASAIPYASQQPGQVHPARLFLACCLALISTSVAFGVLTSNMDQFKSHFQLTNTQGGWIGGVTMWGFTISIFVLGPLVDWMGIRLQMWIAFACHLAGTLVMVFAQNFATLFAGGFLIALGNGTVEAACNPLVATLFPNNKTTKFNQFHVWFPGGIVIGGLLAFLLDNTLFKATPGAAAPTFLGLVAWQFKLLLVIIPTIAYGILFMGQSFPKTERVQSGMTFGQMVQAAFNPLFILMLLCMCLTASLELGPGRWMGTAMSKVMDFAGDNAGILVLVYGTGLMAVLRFFAGPIVHRLSPTGMLLMSAILGGVGLFLLSQANVPGIVFVAATIFYVGVCYFWPTMLGFVSERLPRTGALGLALMGGMGMAFVGLVAAPVMGAIGDTYQHRQLTVDKTAVVQLLQKSAVPDAAGISEAAFDPKKAVKALQEIVKQEPALEGDAAKLLGTSDDYGMRWGFRWTSVVAVPLVVVFAGLFLRDKLAGGYKAERIGDGH